MELKTKLLSEAAILPTRGSADAAGLDFYASEEAYIYPGERKLVATGIAMAIPVGYYGRVAPRSGLAVKQGLDVLAGVIDADYRGEIKVLLINHADATSVIKPGDRIAQLIIEKIGTPTVVQVDDLDDTDRGDAGYGSTGR